MFYKNIDKETIRLLTMENKELKKENIRLSESLKQTERFKNEYRELIKKVSGLEELYSKKLSEMDALIESYQKDIESLTKK